ncbi:GNAT family N-acetyltransferase [Neptunicoccus cionae]|uniref:Acetyltransferase n=1 Tax=Neptunicoccus cionae TaxID=2035344 RepID=A0A916VMA1_9RHOB|nr:GNAT family protein [Amylibacter cionae]GGA07688.1 acetyltransferase [Amylibacter cionae]
MSKPVGFEVKDWVAPPRPQDAPMEGRYARLERINAEAHSGDLFKANSEDASEGIWDYLPYGPYHAQATYHKWLRDMAQQDDPYFYDIKNKEQGRFCGVASYLRVDPNAGSIEVGHINFAPALQRTRAATEAMYLMMKWAFEAGYRRYEWKCDALNAGSRRAAQRLGFSYEGVFRQATMYKGRNRDTAWFAAIDKEWPALEAAFQAWLDPSNFTPEGRQIDSLGNLTALVRVASDPTLEP